MESSQHIRDSVPASQRTIYMFTIDVIRLMIYRKIVAVYYENHAKHINTMYKKIEGAFALQCVVHTSPLSYKGLIHSNNQRRNN